MTANSLKRGQYMELSTVVGIIVIIVVAVVLMKVLGKVVSLMFSVVGVVLVVWLVVAGMRYLDEQNVRDNLLDSNNLFLLADDDNLITGFATQEDEGQVGDLSDLENPNSEVYDEYYKVVVVHKDALPHKTALMVDAADDADKLELFRNYVEEGLLGDEEAAADNLIEQESEGNLDVYKETLAFKHGIKEVLGS